MKFETAEQLMKQSDIGKLIHITEFAEQKLFASRTEQGASA